MQHEIPVDTLGPKAEPMAEAVEACVHCGFCLPACPTYELMGEEMDSPRGRIVIMKGVLEGEIALDDATEYLDPCLGCLACVTACPSGVEYGELITTFRMASEGQRERTPMDRMVRRLVLETLPYPARFRVAARLGRLAKPLRALAPERFRPMLDLIPASLPERDPLPEVTPARGERKARVALLASCAQQVLAPAIDHATLRVLSRNGVEVVVPRAQGCCGALAAHTGAGDKAREHARKNLAAFPKDVDAIVTNAAGCGSGMQEYGLWLRGEPEQEEAEALARKVKDVSVLLGELGLVAPPPLAAPLRVAYHDACHLQHAQRVTLQPREILGAIPGLELLEIPDAGLCCGSAGTYSIEQPENARKLGSSKASAIASLAPDAVATGNIGCLVQLRTHLRTLGADVPVLHTMQILDRAYAASS